MIQTLQQIPGPDFLFYFFILAVLCIVIGRVWINADGTTLYPLPKMTRFDPISLAAMKGGAKLVLETTLFSLQRRGVIDVKRSGKEISIEKTGSLDNLSDPVEAEIYNYKFPCKPREILQDANLKERIETRLAPVYQKMERLSLIRNQEGRKRMWSIMAGMIVVVGGIGGMKLRLGWENDRPVFFLIILLCGALFFLYKLLAPKMPALTSQGFRYLKELEKHFEWLKLDLGAKKKIEGIDPAMAVAIFGIEFLADSPFFAPYADAFHADTWGGCSGCSGGCSGGSSCGGCGSSCGGCGGCG